MSEEILKNKLQWKPVARGNNAMAPIKNLAVVAVMAVMVARAKVVMMKKEDPMVRCLLSKEVNAK
jgi:hypothetical protein